VLCCRRLQELSRQREDDLNSTAEMYKTQLEKCNVEIAEVHFGLLTIAITLPPTFLLAAVSKAIHSRSLDKV
jgi:hypothetical protein